MSALLYLVSGVMALLAIVCLALINRSVSLMLPTITLELELCFCVLAAILALGLGAVVARLETIAQNQGT